MSVTVGGLLKLYKDLLPEGSAFNVPENGTYEKLVKGISEGLVNALLAGFNILDVIYADNDNFTIEDARDWYSRLGLVDSGSVSLSDMSSAINASYSRLGSSYYRQDRAFIQSQLRAAGFDVYVYENRFDNGAGGLETRTPATILGYYVGSSVMGSINYGQANYGGSYAAYGITLIANYLEAVKDATFVIGSNYRSTFFIAGAAITTFATVPIGREIEFRQLILQLKPVQMVGFLFVDYI